MGVKMFQHVVDDYPEVNKPLSARFVKSFAYPTFKERIPMILDGIINDLKDEKEIKEKFGQNAVEEVGEIITKILNLKNSMQSDKPLTDIVANGKYSCEVSVYNKLIKEKTKENHGNPPTWFQTEWLFAECYHYFKLNEIFYLSNSMKKFDPFFKVKVSSLLASRDAVLQLAKWLHEVKEKKSLTEKEKEEIFAFALKCSLWGNKADLSLSCGKTIESKDDTFSGMEELDKHVLVNDINEAYRLLEGNDVVIDIVLDNAGYELFNDLCFADYLIWSGIAKKVIFHGKAIPWFVSDVTPVDFNKMLELLQFDLTSEHTVSNVKDWNQYLREGKWELRNESFWILPHDYSKMQAEDPQLYSTLGKSRLVIFKGDLNYRKLMGDIYWEPTTPFRTALRGFGPTNVLALRTIKADTVSGLQKGVFEKLNEHEPGWLITGNYALIQLDKN